MYKGDKNKMSTQIITLDTPELKDIELSKSQQIKAIFEPMVKMLAEFESRYDDVLEKSMDGIDEDLVFEAKELREAIGKVKKDADKLRKEKKEPYLRAGKAIDAVNNVLKYAIQEKEEVLKSIEEHHKVQAQKRRDDLQEERVKLLAPYVENANLINLHSMPEDVFNAYFTTKKKEHEDKLLAEQKEKEEQIKKEKAEKEENERIRKENEKLKEESRLLKLKEQENERIVKQNEQLKKEAFERELKDKEVETKTSPYLRIGDGTVVEDIITIPIKREEYFSLKVDEMEMRRLNDAGVDNWDWYSEAINPEGKTTYQDEVNNIKKEIFGDEGKEYRDKCNRNGCQGIILVDQYPECSCHIISPCSRCTGPLMCTICDYGH